MINATFTGNVFDDLGNSIDCYYDVYYIRQKKLVQGLRTEYTQYNFNAGDAFHLTQDGDFKDNDVVLVRFNTLKNTTDYSDKFVSIAVTYKGESTIVKDVELKNVQKPSCNFSVFEGTINNEITLNVNKSLDYSWDFKGTTMYQRKNLHAYTIFPGLEIFDYEILYNFDGFWVNTNKFTYTSIGNKEVHYKIQMKDGTELICSEFLKIKYNEPKIEHTVIGELKINSEIDINTLVTDYDNRVTNIEHIFDYSLIENNTTLNYTYSQSILENKVYKYKTIVHWNDGFEDRTTEKISEIRIENQAPEINPEIEYINSSKNNIKVIPNASDPEDELDYVKYKIYIRKETIFEKTNEVDYTWVLLDVMESNILDMGVFIDFYKSGNFKIEVQAFDKSGLGSEIKELFVDIECSTQKDQCTGYFDWSKTTSQLKFKLEESQLRFKLDESQLKFKLDEQSIKFKIDSSELKFKIQEEDIKFSLNCVQKN